MQAAGGFIGFAVELTACVQLGHDDFKRRFSRHLRVLINRNAASVIADGQKAFGVQIDFNEIGMACNGFVHRVIDDFREEVVQGFFVGAADIHAGAQANRFQPFENANGGGVVIISA